MEKIDVAPWNATQSFALQHVAPEKHFLEKRGKRGEFQENMGRENAIRRVTA